MRKDDIVEKQEKLMCNNKADLTILSKHCDRSDELYTWCVHWYEDHTVLAMPEKQVHKQKGHHTWAAAPILLRCFFNQLLLLGIFFFFALYSFCQGAVCTQNQRK